MSGTETILVGVDGSPESLEAAEWAGASIMCLRATLLYGSVHGFRIRSSGQ